VTSQIDFTKPVQGNPTTKSVRDNFQIAHDEISALQVAMVGLPWTVGPGLNLNATTSPYTIDVATPYLPLNGGTINGNLVINNALNTFGQVATHDGFAFLDRTTPTQVWEWYSDNSEAFLWANGRVSLGVDYATGNIDIPTILTANEISARQNIGWTDRTTPANEWQWYADTGTAGLWNSSGIISLGFHFDTGDAEFTGNVLFDKQLSVPTPTTTGGTGPNGPNAPGHIGSMWCNWGAMAHRVADRLFVGSDAFGITGNLVTTGSDGSTDYISSLPGTQAMSFPLNATLVSHSPYGLVGAHFASKASLYNADAGATLAGHRVVHAGAWSRAVAPLSVGGQATAIAFTAVGLYDDVTNNTSGSVGYLEGRRYAGTIAGGLGLEIDICNAGAVAVSTPYDIAAGGTITGALWIACGGSDPVTFGNNASLALGFVPNTHRFNKCIVVDQNALDTTVGSGGNGTFLELAIGQGIRWVDNTGAVKGEMWASSTAMHITPTPVMMADVTQAMVSTDISSSGDIQVPPGDGVFLIDSASGPVDLALGAGIYTGQKLMFKDVAGHAATNNIVLNATDDLTMDGDTSLTLNSDYASVSLMWFGLLWGVI